MFEQVGHWLSDVFLWLAQSTPEVATNLVAAAFGGASVWVSGRARRRLRLVRIRRIWKGIAERGGTVIISVFSLDSLEPSGLVGLGDFEALISVQEQFRMLGLKVKIEPANDLASRELRRDLVLIGGPDGNNVTAEVIRRIRPKPSFTFPVSGHPNILVDMATGVEYRPEHDATGRITADYGLIVRAPNPLADDGTEVTLLAGCWGHGTAAAADSLRGKALQAQAVSVHRPFEALVRVEVLNGRNHGVSVLEVRALESGDIRRG